jgi:lipopolysaccharide transport system permease protein
VADRSQHIHQTIIRANLPWWHIPWKEIAEYRDLFRLMVKRDLTAIYKQTILGPLWFIIQPLVTTIVFTVIFGKVANVSTDGVPHLIFYMCGTVLWNYFQGCMTQGANSLVGNARVLSKVYFPRLIIPLSGLLTNLAHFLLNLLMFFCFFIYFFFFTNAALKPSLLLVFFPLLVLQCALIGLGVGLWVAALTTKYQDLRFALSFLTQIWMYATPIVYPASLIVSPTYRLLLWSNPMSFVVECSRWMFTGSGTVTTASVAISVGMTLFLLVSGLFLFNKVQRTFVDTI